MNQPPTHESTRSLMLEFLNWAYSRPRSYGVAMTAWKSSCPRHPVFDDALSDGLIEIEAGSSIDARIVTLTSKGLELLHQK